MRIRAISLMLCCGLGSVQAAAPDPANSKSIKTFINCINDVLIAATSATDISLTVSACIPDNACFMTGTSNESSAQPACTLDLPTAKKTIHFPRILLECPGPARTAAFDLPTRFAQPSPIARDCSTANGSKSARIQGPLTSRKLTAARW